MGSVEVLSRGSGRTARMLAKVKDGDTVVVHAESFISYAKALLPEGVTPRWVVVRDAKDWHRVRGLPPERVHVDHCVLEQQGPVS